MLCVIRKRLRRPVAVELRQFEAAVLQDAPARALQQELLLAPDLEAALVAGNLLPELCRVQLQEIVQRAHRRPLLLIDGEVAQIIVDREARRRAVEKLFPIRRIIGRFLAEPIFEVQGRPLAVRARTLQWLDAPLCQKPHDEAVLLLVRSRRPSLEQLLQRYTLQKTPPPFLLLQQKLGGGCRHITGTAESAFEDNTAIFHNKNAAAHLYLPGRISVFFPDKLWTQISPCSLYTRLRTNHPMQLFFRLEVRGN